MSRFLVTDDLQVSIPMVRLLNVSIIYFPPQMSIPGPKWYCHVVYVPTVGDIGDYLFTPLDEIVPCVGNLRQIRTLCLSKSEIMVV